MIKPKRAFKILKEKCQEIDFSNFSSVKQIEDIITEKKIFLNIPFKIAAGATKAVIIFLNENFVIKIPFKGFTNYLNQYFAYPNYCEKEKEIYKEAIYNNLEMYFIPCYHLGKIGKKGKSISIYSQRKVTVLNDNATQSFLESDEIEYDENELSRSKAWNLDFIENYSYDEYQNLINFLLYENDISDFHSGNIGYYQKKPVIFDFGGYSSST